jgi:hypothetical protein
MLLIYRVATGEVVENQGTNSLFPEGVPDAMAWGNRDRTGLALLRLDDNRHAALVQQVLTHQVTVKDGKVIIGDPLVVTPAPDPVDPLEEIRSTLAWVVSVLTGVE